MSCLAEKIKSFCRSFISKEKVFFEGVRDGIPIGLGYFAVSFSLGFTAREAGLTAFQGFLASLLNNASAGEYAGFTVIRENAPYWQMAIMILIANARYLLMSCAMSQKFAPAAPMWQRALAGFGITDEIFGISIAVDGKLNPYYTFGAMAIAIPGWSLGSACGVILGNILPLRVVSALSVGLYGMFIAIIIPPAKKNRVVAGLILLSFGLSFLFDRLPLFGFLSEGVRIIVLTVAISLGAALLFPIRTEQEEHGDAA